MEKELSVNQINGKIKRIEENIEGTKKGIAMYQEWIDNPHDWTTEWDIKSYKKTIREYEKKINKWEAQAAEYKGMLIGKVKEYPKVRAFVEAWKKACIDHITNPETIQKCLNAWKEMKEDQDRVEAEYKAKGYKSWESYNARRDIEKRFNRDWGYIAQYIRGGKIDMERLEKDYKYEAERKYNKFIEDAEFYVGEIVDTSNLSVGKKGDLNGWVIGKKAKAEVDTISACGEVQRFHYRTLFKVQK